MLQRTSNHHRHSEFKIAAKLWICMFEKLYQYRTGQSSYKVLNLIVLTQYTSILYTEGWHTGLKRYQICTFPRARNKIHNIGDFVPRCIRTKQIGLDLIPGKIYNSARTGKARTEETWLRESGKWCRSLQVDDDTEWVRHYLQEQAIQKQQARDSWSHLMIVSIK